MPHRDKTERLRYIREWRKRNPEKVRRYNQRYINTHPTAHLAHACHAWISAAVRGGFLKRPSHCAGCHTEWWYLEAHHFDYMQPQRVVWVCRDCHRRIENDSGFAEQVRTMW